MSKFCGNCGKELDDNAVFCANCGNQTNEQINTAITNNSSKKKVKFHWEIPFILFIQFIVVEILRIIINLVNNEKVNECIQNLGDNCNDPSVLMNIMNFIKTFSIFLAIFIVPSFIAILIVYLVQKGKDN